MAHVFSFRENSYFIVKVTLKNIPSVVFATDRAQVAIPSFPCLFVSIIFTCVTYMLEILSFCITMYFLRGPLCELCHFHDLSDISDIFLLHRQIFKICRYKAISGSCSNQLIFFILLPHIFIFKPLLDKAQAYEKADLKHCIQIFLLRTVKTYYILQNIFKTSNIFKHNFYQRMWTFLYSKWQEPVGWIIFLDSDQSIQLNYFSRKCLGVCKNMYLHNI